VATALALFNLSVPAFWLGIILIIIVSVNLQLLPPSGMHTVGRSDPFDLVPHLVLPAVVASSFLLANLARYTRASMIESLDQPFILVAHAKGLNERRIVWVHALKHAMLPIVTVVGLSMPQLFGGAAITETVFGWPGLGRLGIEAAVAADYPVVMGVTLVVSAIVIIANLLTDISYTILDPRVRLG
jgi:peptide/nickel transport system permease protein